MYQKPYFFQHISKFKVRVFVRIAVYVNIKLNTEK